MATRKNIMPMRVYVKVSSDFDATGYMQPRSIVWKDGRSFQIERVKDFRPASSLERGQSGDRYTVVIHGEEKFLYFERTDPRFSGRFGRWWVEKACEE